MAESITDGELEYQGNVRVPFRIFEHSSHTGTEVGTVKQSKTFHSPWMYHKDNLYAMGPACESIEFRWSHRNKAAFAGRFELGSITTKTPLSHKIIGSMGGGPYYLTCGKLATYQSKLFSVKELARSLDGGLAGGALTSAEGLGMVMVAAGASSVAAPVVIGATAAIVAAYIAKTAIKNHIKNLKEKQVFVRISRMPESGVLGCFFPVEEKIYRTERFSAPMLSFAHVKQFVENNITSDARQ
ncbi:MAG: hypothetical protein ACI841_002575 [Planctomycetota bacterium]|jgi:hypothetical protein